MDTLLVVKLESTSVDIWHTQTVKMVMGMHCFVLMHMSWNTFAFVPVGAVIDVSVSICAHRSLWYAHVVVFAYAPRATNRGRAGRWSVLAG